MFISTIDILKNGTAPQGYSFNECIAFVFADLYSMCSPQCMPSQVSLLRYSKGEMVEEEGRMNSFSRSKVK